jgi:hypothetical protein
MMNKQLTLIKSASDDFGNVWILWSHGNYNYSVDVLRADQFSTTIKMDDTDYDDAVAKFDILSGRWVVVTP